jgi:hypothetical protein
MELITNRSTEAIVADALRLLSEGTIFARLRMVDGTLNFDDATGAGSVVFAAHSMERPGQSVEVGYTVCDGFTNEGIWVRWTEGDRQTPSVDVPTNTTEWKFLRNRIAE